jgi:hypothetical protein
MARILSVKLLMKCSIPESDNVLAAGLSPILVRRIQPPPDTLYKVEMRLILLHLFGDLFPKPGLLSLSRVV